LGLQAVAHPGGGLPNPEDAGADAEAVQQEPLGGHLLEPLLKARHVVELIGDSFADQFVSVLIVHKPALPLSFLCHKCCQTASAASRSASRSRGVSRSGLRTDSTNTWFSSRPT